jgi:hypothetical protein
MKKQLLKALTVLAIIGATSTVQAYRYSFTNHTNKEIGVAMQFYGLGEPRYFRWIPAHQAREFAPNQPIPSQTGAELPVEGRKIGFILRDLWFTENPPASAKVNREAAKLLPWRAITITWIPSSSYEKALDLAEAVGHTTEGAGKLALEAGAAYASGGASVAAEAAGSAAAKATGTADALQSAGSNISGLGLANLLKNVGRVASESMMRDRHIDIVEDETGKISFISLL